MQGSNEEEIKYFSTFSGIGGFELGIERAFLEQLDRRQDGRGESYETNDDEERERLESETSEDSATEAGWVSEHTDFSGTRPKSPTCIGFSELDKYAVQIYQSHFPDHTNYGDITKIVAEELPDFDLLVGGFPCQAFSIAGKRGGFSDTRGTLFFDLARILRAKQPRLCLFENVKGLLSHDEGRTFTTIISALDELGYDIQWQVLNSKDFGVPQNRERVFIAGHLRGTPRPQVFPIAESNGKDNGESRQKPVTGNDFRERTEKEKVSTVYISNTTMVGPRIRESHHTGTLQAKDAGGQGVIVQLNQPTHSNDRVYADIGISPALNTMQSGNRQPFVKGLSQIRRLTPTECERLQGFPDGWTSGVSDTQRYKTLGNAVTVNVIEAIMEKLL